MSHLHKSHTLTQVDPSTLDIPEGIVWFFSPVFIFNGYIESEYVWIEIVTCKFQWPNCSVYQVCQPIIFRLKNIGGGQRCKLFLPSFARTIYILYHWQHWKLALVSIIKTFVCYRWGLWQTYKIVTTCNFIVTLSWFPKINQSVLP